MVSYVDDAKLNEVNFEAG